MSSSRSLFFVDPLCSRMAEDLHLGGMIPKRHDADGTGLLEQRT